MLLVVVSVVRVVDIALGADVVVLVVAVVSVVKVACSSCCYPSFQRARML